MSIIIIGSSGTTANVDGTVYQALKVTARPVDYGLLGSYSIERTNTPTGGGTAGSIGCFLTVRWIDPIVIALVWNVQLQCFDLLSGTPDAAAFQQISLYANRQYTAPATGTDAAATLGTGNKVRSSMGSSFASNLVITSTNGTATAGTSFADSQPIGQVVLSTPGAVAQAGNQILAKPFDLYGQLEKKGNAVPLVFVQNEGFTIQATLNSLTSVQIQTAYLFSWSEVAIY